jgi:hypothetical protein
VSFECEIQQPRSAESRKFEVTKNNASACV